LLHLELAYRRRHGELPTLAEYLSRFPQRERLVRAVFEWEGLEPAGEVPVSATAARDDASPPPAEAPTLPPPSPAAADAAVSEQPTLDPDSRATPFPRGTPETVLRSAEPDGEGAEGLPGPAVPGYEILGTLGEGGLGVVYKARHLALNRTVALKMILHREHARPTDLERFQIEAEAVARMHHPNIVQIFEIGAQNGQPFFSLEFCDGGSLAGKIKGTPLPARCGRVGRNARPGHARRPRAQGPAPRPQAGQRAAGGRRHAQDRRLRPRQETR
jgi:hypothetical protein